MDKDLTWKAKIRNISTRGLGLVLGRRFEPGAGLAIEIPETDTRPADTLLAKVVRVNPQPDGSWLLGCAFVSELGDDELEALLQLALPELPPDEVISPAQVEEEQATALSENESPAVLIPRLWLVNTAGQGVEAGVSVRRLFLSGSWPVPAGTFLKLRVANRGDMRAVKVKVQSCRQADGRWTLTYRFVDAPSPELRRLFGGAAF
jgi:hypothetical protein